MTDFVNIIMDNPEKIITLDTHIARFSHTQPYQISYQNNFYNISPDLGNDTLYLANPITNQTTISVSQGVYDFYGFNTGVLGSPINGLYYAVVLDSSGSFYNIVSYANNQD